jgi:hypothetical protein
MRYRTCKAMSKRPVSVGVNHTGEQAGNRVLLHAHGPAREQREHEQVDDRTSRIGTNPNSRSPDSRFSVL